MYRKLALVVTSQVPIIDVSNQLDLSSQLGRFYKVYFHGSAPDDLLHSQVRFATVCAIFTQLSFVVKLKPNILRYYRDQRGSFIEYLIVFKSRTLHPVLKLLYAVSSQVKQQLICSSMMGALQWLPNLQVASVQQ